MIVKTSPIYRLQLLPRPCLHRVLPGLVFAGLRSRLDLIMTTRDRGLQDSASNEGYPKVRNHGEGPY